ncbi:MAG TPA: hypothetical protein VK589_20785, partial [Chryseolinea sp.]|nr:hypothetical protein [Chryseolinea sp.]
MRILILSLLVCLCLSCVSKKKYDDLVGQKIATEASLAERSGQLDQATAELKDLNEKLARLKEDTTNLGIDKRSTSDRLASLEKEHEQLNTLYKNLVSSSGKLNKDLSQQQQQLLAMQENLEKTRRMNDSLSINLADREKKVKELEQVLASKEKAVQDLKNKITNAL